MAEDQQPHWSDILKRRIANSKKGETKCKLTSNTGLRWLANGSRPLAVKSPLIIIFPVGYRCEKRRGK